MQFRRTTAAPSSLLALVSFVGDGLLTKALLFAQVIRANDDYQPDEALIQSFAKAGAQVLSFSKGDFFHVIGREDDPHWYEACNPALPDARGLVPVSYFQVLGRTERDSSQSDGGRMPAAKIPDHDSGYGETAMHPTAPTTLSHSQQNSKSAKASGILHATVRYTFTADPARPDELSAQENEPLIIIAQSNNEWVVAKPIERLGGPGLIPIGFINVYDQDSYKNSPPTPVSDSLEAIRKAGVPSVEEWKRMAAQYKNSSITLGKFDGGRSNAGQQAAIEQGMGRMSLHQAQGGLNGTQVSGNPKRHALSKIFGAKIRPCLARSSFFLTDIFSSVSTTEASTGILGRVTNRLTQTRLELSRRRSSRLLYGPVSHDTALPRISIGLSLRPSSRTAAVGNCRATTRTFTISRLLSSPSFLPRLATREPRSELFPICQAP